MLLVGLGTLLCDFSQDCDVSAHVSQVLDTMGILDQQPLLDGIREGIRLLTKK